jgi:hypothetical protein
MREAEPEKRIERSEADLRGDGRKPEAARVGGSNFPGGKEQSGSREPDLIERMLEQGNMLRAMQGIQRLLRGWAGYFSVAETRQVFEDLDQWLRRKLRCMEWRKWKRPWTRMKRLIALGLDRERARASAFNGRGPWWNAGASHMNAALPTSYFRKLGLLSLLEEVHRQTLRRKARSL